jgi:hypothetical protein
VPRLAASLAAVLLGLQTLAADPALAVDYESHVVTIDATTAQPVGTGFVPADSTGELIIFAEGGYRAFANTGRFDLGWNGPAGMTRMQRGGQPILSGMPYGALVGGFSTNIANYRYVGRMGAFHLLSAHVGKEFRLALNMSSTDLSALEGELTVTVIYVKDGAADLARLEIKDGTTLPVGTGIVATLGDQFIVLPYGAIQTAFPRPAFTDGYFAPEGISHFNRLGEPYSEGPYGGLYGYFVGPSAGFYIGDGGMWKAGIPANGRELFLNLNLDPADMVGSDGRFIVNVIRIHQ